MQGVILALVYLITASAAVGALDLTRPKADFGPMDPSNPNGIYGKQDCLKFGAQSLLILEIVVTFLGVGIYVRNNKFSHFIGRKRIP